MPPPSASTDTRVTAARAVVRVDTARAVSDLEARVAVLEATVAALTIGKQRARLRRDDEALLVRLLPALAGLLGSREFLSRELIAMRDAGLRVVLAGRTAKTIGRLLRRAEGVPIAGFVVEACGVEVNVHRFAVRKVL